MALDRVRLIILASGITAISFVVLITVIFLAPPSFLDRQCGDCQSYYYPVAKNLLSGKGLKTVSGEPAYARPPGHVFILAGVMAAGMALGIKEESTIYLFNSLAIACSAALLFLIGCRYWSMAASTVISVLWIVNPFVLWFLNQPYTEIPFLVALFSGCLAFLSGIDNDRKPSFWLFISGCLFGIAMLIRPIGIGIPFVLVPIIWLSQKGITGYIRCGRIAAFIVGAWLFVAPWQIYVHRISGEVILLGRSHQVWESLGDGLTFAVRDKGYRAGIDISADLRRFMEEMEVIIYQNKYVVEVVEEDNDLDRKEKFISVEEMVRITFDKMAQDPVMAAEFVLLKILRSWYGTDSNRNETLSKVIQIPYLSLIMFSIVACWKHGRRVRLLTITLLVITTYFWITTAIFLPLVRYMVPASGLLLILIPGLYLSKNRTHNYSVT